MTTAYAMMHDECHMVEFTLDKGDRVLGNTKDMMYMDSGISQDLDHNSIIEYINDDFIRRKIVFGSPSIRKIVPIDLSRDGFGIYCLNKAFLCAANESTIEIRHEIRSDILVSRSNPIVLQLITGDGTVFVSASGTVIRKDLVENEILRIEIDCLLAMTQNVQYDYQVVGSGVYDHSYVATMVGPGTLWLQTNSRN